MIRSIVSGQKDAKGPGFLKRIRSIYFDLILQYRNGFYFAYLVVGVLYIAILRFLPESLRSVTAILLVFSDTSVIGFFFVGSIVLLEKSEGTLDALFVTPFRPSAYIVQKVLSLTLMALLSSLFVVLGGIGLRIHIFLFMLAVLQGSIVFTLFGLAVAARARTINDYFYSSVLYSAVFFLPLLGYARLLPRFLFSFFPTDALLVLLEASFVPVPWTRLLFAALNLCVWIVLAFLWSKSWFYRYLIRKEPRG